MTTTKLKSIFSAYFNRRQLSLLALLLLASCALYSQQSLFQSIADVQKLNLVITTDLERITGERNLDESQEGHVQIYSGKKMISEWEIKIDQRGRFRRKVCEFPPLKLDFDKDELAEKGFAKFDKFKLVTHCISDKFYSTENVAKEYLAYQLYNEITPFSYRTILTKVTYIDSNNPKNKLDRYGILIEPTKELATRIDAKEREDVVNPGADVLDAEVSAQVSMFQYMIGNEDWSIQLMRNVKAFQSKETGKYILVPYDFDFSGFVNTKYALPSSDLGLRKVTDRGFIGLSTTENILEQTKLNFLAKRDRFDDIINSTKRLSGQGRFLAKVYLEGFFEEIDSIPFPTVQLASKKTRVNRVGEK